MNSFDRRPARTDPPLAGLEIWLNGTPAELDAAARVLAQIGRIAHHGRRTALTGSDTGRFHTYARIHVPTGKPRPATTTTPGHADDPDRPALPDVD